VGRKSHVPIGRASCTEHCIALLCMHVIFEHEVDNVEDNSFSSGLMLNDKPSHHQFITGRTSVGCVLIYSACRSFSSPFFGSRFSQKRLRLPNSVGIFLRTIRRYDVNCKGVAQGVWGQTSKMDPI
jgi:hypothetical protein